MKILIARILFWTLSLLALCAIASAQYIVAPSVYGFHTTIAQGSISPSTTQTVSSGGSVTFTAIPDSGYEVAEWAVNGYAVQTGGNTFTLSNVTANLSVQLYIQPGTGPFTVYPIQQPGGSISPSTNQTVSRGGSVALTAVPDSGYIVGQWYVNYLPVQTGGNNYTVSNIIGNTNAFATFWTAPAQSTLTPSAGANGSISPNTAQTVSSGGSATFTATPNPGYTVNQWVLNGTPVQTGGTGYTVSNVTGDTTVHVTFKLLTNLGTWRQTYFPGSTSTTGPGADAASPLNDGVNNLIKFATGMDPTRHGSMPGILTSSGNNLVFTYTPSAAAVADGVNFTVEYCDTLGIGSWASDVVNQGTIGSGGALVTATVPKGSNNHLCLRLKITSQ